MKNVFLLASVLFLITACDKNDDMSENCVQADWVGEYVRIDGSGCSDWESMTNATMSVKASTFNATDIYFFTAGPFTPDGCSLETEVITGIRKTYELNGNQIEFKEFKDGCKATYEKQ